MNETIEQAIVCDLTAIPAAEREAHLLNAPRIFQAAEEICELANGYRFRLPNADGMWLALATFVENERRCCPFWRFGLSVEPNNGSLWLELTGPESGKELLTSALGAERVEGMFQQLINTGGEARLEQAVARSAEALAGIYERLPVS